MARSRTAARDAALRALARLLRAEGAALQAANALDLRAARGAGLAAPMVDRLRSHRGHRDRGRRLRADRRHARPDRRDHRTQAPAQRHRRGPMRVPLGVFGMIYESRPNVTIEAASLAIKSGNACILRGGSEALHSNLALWRLVQAALVDAGLPAEAVQLVQTTDRAAVGHLIAMPQYVDVIIPRGGKGLIERVSRRGARAGDQAPGRQLPCLRRRRGRPRARVAVTDNAKTQKYSPCNAAESLLVHAARPRPSCRASAPCSRPRAWRCAADAQAARPRAVPRRELTDATEADWSRGVPRARHQRQGGRIAGRGHRPHQPLRLAPHRRHPDRRTTRARCASCARSIRPA